MISLFGVFIIIEWIKAWKKGRELRVRRPEDVAALLGGGACALSSRHPRLGTGWWGEICNITF